MTWQLDVAHSRVYFSARHMMVATVRGEFEKFDVKFDFDHDQPHLTKVDVEIDTSTINTREANRDGHLKSPDILDVANFPKMIFKSTKVDIHGDKKGKLYGDLTIKDVTKPVVLDVEYTGVLKTPWGGTMVGFTGSTKVNRKDYGLVWNQVIEGGGVLVGEDITINIEIEFAKVEETATQTATA